MNLLRAISTGAAAFAATNLDDILILTLLFSQVDGELRCFPISIVYG